MKALLAACFALVMGFNFCTATFAQPAPTTPSSPSPGPPAGDRLNQDEGKQNQHPPSKKKKRKKPRRAKRPPKPDMQTPRSQ